MVNASDAGPLGALLHVANDDRIAPYSLSKYQARAGRGTQAGTSGRRGDRVH